MIKSLCWYFGLSIIVVSISSNGCTSLNSWMEENVLTGDSFHIELPDFANVLLKHKSILKHREKEDKRFLLPQEEVDLLSDFYTRCGTKVSTSLKTWCTGLDETFPQGKNGFDCPHGVKTHPCSGLVLSINGTEASNTSNYLEPWQGVRCNTSTLPASISHIFLRDNSLKCRLEDFNFSNFPALQVLDLEGNLLWGELPQWIGSMTSLEWLNLNHNNFSGPIKSSIADNPRLKVLRLAENPRLFGSNSLSFLRALQLQQLDLAGNNLSVSWTNGFLSPELRYLNLSRNRIHGDFFQISIPILPKIIEMNLSFNFLIGELPQEIALWGRKDPHDPDLNSTFQVLDVSNNFLTGKLPYLGNQTNLRHLIIRNNHFSGSVTEELLPHSLLRAVKPHDFMNNDWSCALAMDNNTFWSSLVQEMSPHDCICPDGYTNFDTIGKEHKSCKPCIAGSFKNSTSTHEVCTECPIGTSTNGSAGQQACTHCPPGTFSNTSGLTSCLKCPVGHSSISIGSSKCKKCLPGEYIDIEGSSACRPCPKGTYSDKYGSIQCKPCLEGTFNDEIGVQECSKCPSHSFQNDTSAVSCKKCPPGHIAPYEGSTKCFPCAAGYFLDEKQNACLPCEKNAFTNSTGQTKCIPCESTGTTNGIGATKCLPFVRKGHEILVDGSFVSCKPGFYYDGTYRGCQPCPIGHYTDTEGQSQCFECPRGSFVSKEGSSECQLAPIGSYVDQKGAWRSLKCNFGEFSDTNGSIRCKKCPPNTVSHMGSSVCDPIKAGELLETQELVQLQLKITGIDGDLSSDDRANVILERLVNTLKIHVDLATADLLELSLSNTWTESKATQVFEFHLFQKNSTLSTEETSSTSSGSSKSLDGHNLSIESLLNSLDSSSFDEFFDFTDKTLSEKQANNLTEILTSGLFLELFSSDLNTISSIDHGSLSPLLMQMNVLGVKKVQINQKCRRGTFYESSGQSPRCLPCPKGTFSSIEGSLECLPCKRGFMIDHEGASECDICPFNHDSFEGSTECFPCSFLDRDCRSFWRHLLLTVVLTLITIFVSIRYMKRVFGKKYDSYDPIVETKWAAGIRSEGRRFGYVYYQPMGTISTETILGYKYPQPNTPSTS